jgi:hypothetical protein
MSIPYALKANLNHQQLASLKQQKPNIHQHNLLQKGAISNGPVLTKLLAIWKGCIITKGIGTFCHLIELQVPFKNGS